MEDLSQNGYFWLVIWAMALITHTMFVHPYTIHTHWLRMCGRCNLVILFVVTVVCYGERFLYNLETFGTWLDSIPWIAYINQ